MDRPRVIAVDRGLLHQNFMAVDSVHFQVGNLRRVLKLLAFEVRTS